MTTMENKISTTVQTFYNTTPFPDYELERFNSKEDLKLSAQSFSKILDRSIPSDASVIDIGTGTGQLATYLALRRKMVWGVDFSNKSLAKAQALKKKLGLDSLNLKKVDIIQPEEVRGIGTQFDYALCLGVLHHTGDPYQGFSNALKLVKPGGYIAIGLYNKPGRILLKIRRFLATKIFKNNKRLNDWFIRLQIGKTEDREKIRGWWNDQYLHPHESTHTVGEVLRWFRKNDIEYFQSVPSLNPFDESNLEIAGVWNRTGETYPNFLIRFYKQLEWIWKTHREGGYWVMFGRKKL